MVQHRGRDGELHLYSSKPPLLSVLLAGEYWRDQQVDRAGRSQDNPYEVVRLMLLTVNVLPMMLHARDRRAAGRSGSATTDWGRIFVVAAAALGTMLTTFAVVLNNHIVAAVSAAVALDALRADLVRRRPPRAVVRAGRRRSRRSRRPTSCRRLSLLALVGGGAACWRNWRAWLLGFVPAAAVVVAAFFATNYAAHDSLRPPYMHRSETDPEDNWYAYTYTLDGQERQSYWLDPQGIDRGEPSKLTYALHALVGHHGVFSLTPVWLLSVWGAWLWLRGGDAAAAADWRRASRCLSVVCMVFYIGLRPQDDRNYGGMTSGFRWLFWLAPLWLSAMLPAADRAARSRVGMARGAACCWRSRCCRRAIRRGIRGLSRGFTTG